MRKNRLDEARAVLEDALRVGRSGPESHGASLAVQNLGAVQLARGDV
jgi:hypothetical protein